MNPEEAFQHEWIKEGMVHRSRAANRGQRQRPTERERGSHGDQQPPQQQRVEQGAEQGHGNSHVRISIPAAAPTPSRGFRGVNPARATLHALKCNTIK